MDDIIKAGQALPWEVAWPGRLRMELDDLTALGAFFEVEREKLRGGSLVLEVRWALPSGTVHLRVVYPDSYPCLRPMVYLIAAPGPLPRRHYSPYDRQLCLLGRDSRQWNPDWTVAKLLTEQLYDSMNASGNEDPQGEPAEFWWNCCVDPRDYGFCLVDSDWSPGLVDGGMLKVRYKLDKARPVPIFRACVVEAVSSDRSFKADMHAPITDLPETMEVPWLHLKEALYPGSSAEETGANIKAVLDRFPKLGQAKARKLDIHHQGKLLAISYPTEVAFRQSGTGWLFLLSMGKDAVRPGQRHGMSVVRTLRSGAGDLAVRNPSAKPLEGKRIGLVGAGAVGSPIALELAKNGCAGLDVVDHDVVEPGNSVRWIAGQKAWGRSKAEAVKAEVERNWPMCKVNAWRHAVGSPEGDQKLFNEVLGNCDLIVDASAAYGVTLWLGERCRAGNMPLVSAMATADVENGVVALFRPSGGCPRCLEHAWHRGDVPEFGKPGVEPAIQPPGCSERTFEGGSYDLQELSLQAVRSVLAVFGEDVGSVVASLAFSNGIGGLRSASWQVDALRRYDECSCRSAGRNAP